MKQLKKGDVLPNRSGWRCRDCGKIVLGDPDARVRVAAQRLCYDCAQKPRPNSAIKTPQ